MYPPLKHYGISSPYGPRSGGFHRGTDIPCPTGTELPSPIDGVIAFAGAIPAAAAGYSDEIICIIQGQNQFVVMGHLSATLVKTGQTVKKGDHVAFSGNTGYSSGPHLHIELAQGTKAATAGILAYPSTDITPLLENYEGGSMSQRLEDCFLTQAQRHPTKAEIAAWKKSGLEPYTFTQRHAPNPKLDQAKVEAFKACFITLATRWPSEKEVSTWKKSGLSAYEFCQNFAPNIAVAEKNNVIKEKESEVSELQEALRVCEQTKGFELSERESQDLSLGRGLRALIDEAIR